MLQQQEAHCDDRLKSKKQHISKEEENENRDGDDSAI